MIIGTIFGIITAIIIILLVTSQNKKNKKSDTAEKKKEYAIPPQRRYPYMNYKDCRFYAEGGSRFEYSEDEAQQFLSSLEESFSREDYAKTIKISNEIIKILPKVDKIWTRKIAAIFLDVMHNEKCWNEKFSKIIINSCYGFLQCYENVIEKSIAVKHSLLPLLLKGIDEMIRYQNNNVTKYHNLELYNMMFNLYYVMPYREILILLSNYLLEDKTDKEFGENPYIKQTLKNILNQVDILRTRNTSRLQETFDSKKITNCTLITDERIDANIVAFELNFESGKKTETIEASFYDEDGNEINFGKDKDERFVEKFQADSDRGGISKEEIVLLTGENISKVILKILKTEDKENPNSKNEDDSKPKNKSDYENNINEEVENSLDETEEQYDIYRGQMLMYPSFSEMKDCGISDTQFVGLKKNNTVITVGLSEKLKQQVTTWKDIKKIYIKDDAVFGIRENGTVIYAGDSEYENVENIYSWENVESLSLGEKHLVALTKNATAKAIGINNNGECDVEEWYDIIQVDTSYHTVGLRSDGRVEATGENNFGECDVKSWQDIVQVAVGEFYTLGLTSSGKVLSVGLNSCGQCNVGDWANIKKIYAHGNMSIGLRYDGKVVTAGKNSYYYGDIKKWERVKDIVVSNNRIVGIEAGGNVRVAGKPYKNFVNGEWLDVENVVISNNNIVGLKEDGTLVSNNLVFGNCLSDNGSIIQICEDSQHNRIAMLNDKGVLSICSKLKNNSSESDYPTIYEIKRIAMSNTHIVMLKNDGTVSYIRFSDGVVENISGWDNIIDVGTGDNFIMALDISGKVKCISEKHHNTDDISEWHDIVKIQAAGNRAIGLSIDGKLFMFGVSEFGEDDFIKIFKNVKDFALTELQTMILESDGTVKVTYHPAGVDTEGVKVWKDIKKVVPRGINFLCLSELGKVFSTINEEAEVTSWEEIYDIEASDTYVWATLKS